mmetsp:Transcript_26000/g.50593  ORF Transcript_26000/g.50593 Transcript_26000/m.50593 type:complete len:114 (+) Transcript_26000:105-446(+)
MCRSLSMQRRCNKASQFQRHPRGRCLLGQEFQVVLLQASAACIAGFGLHECVCRRFDELCNERRRDCQCLALAQPPWPFFKKVALNRDRRVSHRLNLNKCMKQKRVCNTANIH